MIDTDWLVMRGLARGIAAAAERHLCAGMRLLDFGCGTKPYEALISATGCEYIGSDLGKAGEVEIDGSGRLTASGEFVDAVGSFQVLEHVRDLNTYLSEAHRVLKPSGLLILSTHGTWLYHPQPEDHRRWTRMGLVSELERQGFEIVECQAIVGPLAWTTVLRLTGFGYVLKKVPLVGEALSAAISLVMNARAWVEDRVTPRAIAAENACIYLTVSRRINAA